MDNSPNVFISNFIHKRKSPRKSESPLRNAPKSKFKPKKSPLKMRVQNFEMNF